MKKLSVFIVSLILMFTMVSCGSDNDTNTNSQTSNITVTLDIDFPDNSEAQDVDNVKVTVPEKSSVLDVLTTYGEENNVDIILDEKSESPYVTSINNIKATNDSGWVYELNDEAVMEPADQCTVQEGDKIDWSFETWSDDND
ncbi:MAG: DUF4430 domain-containing protein [Anaerovoracaceae bacterium]